MTSSAAGIGVENDIGEQGAERHTVLRRCRFLENQTDFGFRAPPVPGRGNPQRAMRFVG
jgi:hypothetical protein